MHEDLFSHDEFRENIGLILEQKMPGFDAGLTCAGHAGEGCAH